MSPSDIADAPDTSVRSADPAPDRRMIRWGGLAGLGGVVLLVGAVVVVVSLGLPDASDVETLTDFDDIEAGRIAGPRVHDARVAALCLAHGVRELWTADRDFSRFPGLATSNPLAG